MTALLEVRGLSRKFGGLRAVAELDFQVKAGEILGIIGPNGAGKTTAINLISGFIKPNAGTVRFDGDDVTGVEPHFLTQRGIVRTFQATTLFETRTVRENALRGAFRRRYPGMGAAILGITANAKQRRVETDHKISELLSLFDLDSVGDSIAGSLPYGLQKTLGMVIALASEPRLMMLDEPVAGLSASETDHVRSVIKRIQGSGVTVIVIDHNMRFMSDLCDRVLVMHHGREIAQGSTKAVLSDPAVIEAYLGKAHVHAATH